MHWNFIINFQTCPKLVFKFTDISRILLLIKRATVLGLIEKKGVSEKIEATSKIYIDENIIDQCLFKYRKWQNFIKQLIT